MMTNICYGESMSQPRNNKNFEFDWGLKFRITHVRDRNLTEGRIYPKTEFHRTECRMFRSVDWTHDMIIVKWQLLTWTKRKLCALTNRPPAQSTGTRQWLSRLFHVNCSVAQAFALHFWQFIFPLSCRRRPVLQVFPLSAKMDILKNFLCLWWWQMLWWKHVLTKK